MKKIILSLVILMAANSVLSAQDFEYTGAARPNFNEISVSYGYLTLPHLVTTLGDVLGSVIVTPIGNEKLAGVRSTGSIGLEYMRYLGSGRVAFGAVFAYEGMTTTFEDKNDSSKQRIDKDNVLTFMPSVKVMWFNRRNFGMYSRAGLGITASVGATATRPFVAVQLSAIGMDFGGQWCRGFVEAGLGTQGVINAGIKACF